MKRQEHFGRCVRLEGISRPTIQTLRKNRPLLSLLIVVLTSVSVFLALLYSFHIPIRRYGYDIYSYLGSISYLQHRLGLITIAGEPNVFPHLYDTDPHLGVYLLLWAIVSHVLNLEPIQLIALAGSLNIALLVLSTYVVADYFLNSKNGQVLFSVLILLTPSIIIPNEGIGSYSIADLVVGAAGPLVFSTAMMLFSIAFLERHIKEEKTTNLLLFLVAVFLCFSSHILVGFIMLMTVALLLLFRVFEKKLCVRTLLRIGLPVASILLLYSLWPFYNWIVSLLESAPIQSNTVEADWNDFLIPISIYGLALPGFIWFRKSDSFLSFWAALCVIIPYSFLLPVRIPLYWRFSTIAKFPLLLMLIGGVEKHQGKLGLNRPPNNYAVRRLLLPALITVILISGSVACTRNIAFVLGYEDTSSRFEFLSTLNPETTVLLADPYDSYAPMGLYGIPVVVIPSSHVSSIYGGIQAQERTDELREAMSATNETLLLGMVQEYGVTHVLLRIQTSWYNSTQVISWLESNEIYRNEVFILLEIV